MHHGFKENYLIKIQHTKQFCKSAFHPVAFILLTNKRMKNCIKMHLFFVNFFDIHLKRANIGGLLTKNCDKILKSLLFIHIPVVNLHCLSLHV